MPLSDTRSSRESRTAPSSASSSRNCSLIDVNCVYRRLPEVVPLSRHERNVEGDAVYKAFVALLQGWTNLVRSGLDGEGTEHLVGYQPRHLVPLLVPSELP